MSNAGMLVIVGIFVIGLISLVVIISLSDKKRRYNHSTGQAIVKSTDPSITGIMQIDPRIGAEGMLEDLLRLAKCSDIATFQNQLVGWTPGLWFTRGGDTPCQLVIRYSNPNADGIISVEAWASTRYLEVDSSNFRRTVLDLVGQSFIRQS